MVDGGFQEEAEARAKFDRARLSSTQLSTYFAGSMEMWDIELEVRRRAASRRATARRSTPGAAAAAGFGETPGFATATTSSRSSPTGRRRPRCCGGSCSELSRVGCVEALAGAGRGFGCAGVAAGRPVAGRSRLRHRGTADPRDAGPRCRRGPEPGDGPTGSGRRRRRSSTVACVTAPDGVRSAGAPSVGAWPRAQRVDPIAGRLGGCEQPISPGWIRRRAGFDRVEPCRPAEQLREAVAVEPLDALPGVDADRGPDGVVGEPGLEQPRIDGALGPRIADGRGRREQDADPVGDGPRLALVEAGRAEPGDERRRAAAARRTRPGSSPRRRRPVPARRSATARASPAASARSRRSAVGAATLKPRVRSAPRTRGGHGRRIAGHARSPSAIAGQERREPRLEAVEVASGSRPPSRTAAHAGRRRRSPAAARGPARAGARAARRRATARPRRRASPRAAPTGPATPSRTSRNSQKTWPS